MNVPVSNGLEKKLNVNGQKAYQRTDSEDRTLPYRHWLRSINTHGAYIDADLIKWKLKDDIWMPVVITDITRCDNETAGTYYRDAIIDRMFNRDKQGLFLTRLGEILKIPVYLVLFQKEMKWLWVYSFRRKEWKYFRPMDWAEHLGKL